MNRQIQWLFEVLPAPEATHFSNLYTTPEYFNPEWEAEWVLQEASSVDIKRAVAQNRLYGKRLKWNAQESKIKSFLMSALGLSSITTPEDFARAVATWQQRQGGGKKPDGVVDPNTWAKLQNAIKVASPPPISPSQSSPIPNIEKDPRYLAMGIYQSEFMTLDAWQSALLQFGEVMNAVSDAEGTANFAGVLQKFIEGKLINTIAKPSKSVSAAMGLLDALVAESKRAEQAREGAQLRDFIVRFHRRLTDSKVILSSLMDGYYYQVEKNYKGMSVSDKKAYKKQLVDYLDYLDKMREDGWLNGTRMFQVFAFEWIRNTTAKSPIPSWSDPSESWVKVYVDYKNNVTKARIHAPGGQKIAEQFLKDADGAGLRPYDWPVRRIITYFTETGGEIGNTRLRADRTHDTRLWNPIFDNDNVAELKFKRILAQRPTTKDVKGV